jgi:branched-subunit amino acid transport protein
MSETGMWLLIVGMGGITYGLRAGSLLLGEHLPMTPALRSFLRFVPVAVLSAISAMELFLPDGALDLSPMTNHRLLAGAVAIGVALLTRRMLPTIAAGMLALWLLQGIL